MNSWTLNPIFNSFPLVLGLAGLLLLLLWVKPRFPTATPSRRKGLMLLRLLVIALVTLAMLRPTLISTETKTQSATIAILLDASRSMTLPAAAGDRTRWDAARRSLEQMQPVIKRLREAYDVELFLFDSESRKIASLDGKEFPDEPTGEESDIGTSLDQVVRGLTGKRMAGVFLLSDGVQRASAPRVDLQQPARELARRECPLWTTVFGQARDQSQSRDVAIENLPDQYTVFTNNELEIRAALRVQGYAGKAVPVVLQVEAPDGTSERVGPISLLADEQDQQLDVQLAYTPTQPGAYRLTLRADPQPGEQVTENNELTAFATVLEGGLRVLYIDGNIGWQERKFIRRSLDSSPDIDVDVWLDTRSDRESGIALPWDNASAEYDVFLLGDISATSLGNNNAVKIANAVADGKGLMTLGGVNAYGAGGYARSPLAEVLPMEMDRLERQQADAPIRADVHHVELLQMLPTAEHFVLRLASGGDNAARWRDLPPLSGANRWKKLGDQARVLAAANPGTENEIPLMITGKYGSGRVLSFAGDTTHRWYRYGKAEDHRRFWRQTMLWLAQKDSEGKNEVLLRLAQRRYRRSSRVPVTVSARDELGDFVTDAIFDVRLTGPESYAASVRVTPDADSQFAGVSEALTAAGEYQYTVVATRDGQELGSATGDFQVLDQDLELTDAAANPGQLTSMAAATSEFGGRLLAPEELPFMLEQLADKEVAAEIAYETAWQLADTNRDAGILFALMAGLLIVEWFFRKRWGLV